VYGRFPDYVPRIVVVVEQVLVALNPGGGDDEDIRAASVEARIERDRAPMCLAMVAILLLYECINHKHEPRAAHDE